MVFPVLSKRLNLRTSLSLMLIKCVATESAGFGKMETRLLSFCETPISCMKVKKRRSILRYIFKKIKFSSISKIKNSIT